MQGKGLIKFFLGLMLLVCVYQFSLYFPTNKVEKAAEAANMVDGKVDRDGYRGYLDSISSEDIFSIPGIASFTYNELKGQQLAQGLDLKGGMSLVLQVDLKDFLYKLSNENKDETFNQALDNAQAALKNTTSDYITVFADEYEKIANGKTLGNIFIKNQSLRDDIQFDTPDGQIIALARTKANETVQLTFDRLKERIDKSGVVQPNISLDSERDLIIVELPGVDNPERARILVSKAAKLEFWRVYRASDPGLMQGLAAADEQLKKTIGTEEVEQEREILSIDTNYATSIDGDGNVTVDSSVVESVDTTYAPAPFVGGPLLSLLQPSGPVQTPMLGTAKRNARATISNYLADPVIKGLFPADVKFLWSKDPITNLEGVKTDDYTLYAIKKERGRDGAPLEGDKVTDASAQPDPTTGQIQVSLEMDTKGAQVWGQMTTEAYENGQREIAIVLDDEVVSAPGLRNGPILGGNSSISGDYTIQEAQDLANILKVGKLPADIDIIQEKIVGPTLGAANIAASQWALIIGLGLVLLFMIVYYSGAGLVSIVALVLNIVFIFAALASYGTVLTLPGFAGIVLTIGMAVDANVIIFERIREELRAGKSTAMAIADGFNFSYSAIIDANVTTIITALVLAKFGLGPIKGFAVVLIIGVLASLFTAVLVGRLIFNWYESKGKDISFSTGFSKGAFSNLKIDWLGKRKITYIISGVLVSLGLYALATSSFDLGVDFKGGYSYNIALPEGQSLDRDKLAASLDASFGSPTTVKAVDGGNSFDVTTSYGVDLTDENVDELVMGKLFEGFSNEVSGLDLDQFKDPDGIGAHVESSYKIRPTIADDIRASSFKAGIFALLLIFLYIFIRFSKWQYSLGAVAALFHDVLIVLAVFSFGRYIFGFPLEIDQNFIAAILTVIGYSINDTVVVFDRIREFMGEYSNRSKEEIINLAINNTISRTIITSLTTLFVVAVLFFFGGESTRGLAFALLVGILVGTYSSVFVATPLMSDFSGELKTKESSSGSGKKSFSKAARA